MTFAGLCDTAGRAGSDFLPVVQVHAIFLQLLSTVLAENFLWSASWYQVVMICGPFCLQVCNHCVCTWGGGMVQGWQCLERLKYSWDLGAKNGMFQRLQATTDEVLSTSQNQCSIPSTFRSPYCFQIDFLSPEKSSYITFTSSMAVQWLDSSASTIAPAIGQMLLYPKIYLAWSCSRYTTTTTTSSSCNNIFLLNDCNSIWTLCMCILLSWCSSTMGPSCLIEHYWKFKANLHTQACVMTIS